MKHRVVLMVGLSLSGTVPMVAQCAPSTISSETMSLSVKPTAATSKTGSPALVQVVVTNKSSKDITLWRENGPDAGGSYKIDVRDEGGTLAADTKLGKYRNGHVNLSTIKPEQLDLHYLTGSGACVLLKAGNSLHDEINVGRSYDLATPGVYLVSVSVAGASSEHSVTSNVAKLTVVP
jgi:hypothetical protein